MEDLSRIAVSRIPVKDGLPALPDAVMESFSDATAIEAATRLMGFEEVTDAGS